MRALRLPGPATLGVAIGADRVVLHSSRPRARAIWTRRLPPEEGTRPPQERAEALGELLEAGLAEACAELAVAAARLRVALLPPLAECRRIDLPGLSADESRRVLARDVARHFPGVSGARLVGAARARGDRGVLAATASADVVERVFLAAARTGCVVETVVPAHVAWAASLPSRGAAAGEPGTIVARVAGRIEVAHVEHGAIRALRRLRPGSPEAGALAEREVEDPAALAATHVARAPGEPSLFPERVRAERRRRSALRADIAWAAAAALLVLAASLELAGVRREAARLAARRAALAEEVAGALATRDSMTRAAGRVATLLAAERDAPRWSATLAAVATHLPREAFLLSLEAEGDSLILDAVAERAAPVFESLSRAPGVLAARAQGSIRQEVREDVGSVERFTLVVRLARLPASGSRPTVASASRRDGEGGAP